VAAKAAGAAGGDRKAAKRAKLSALSRACFVPVSSPHDALHYVAALLETLDGLPAPLPPPPLVVRDSASALLTPALLNKEPAFAGLTAMTHLALLLKRAARSHGVAVVLVSSPLTDGSAPLGAVWGRTADVRVRLERRGGGVVATLKDHKEGGERGREARFRVGAGGVEEDVGGQ
jgi:hypothetical protein